MRRLRWHKIVSSTFEVFQLCMALRPSLNFRKFRLVKTKGRWTTGDLINETRFVASLLPSLLKRNGVKSSTQCEVNRLQNTAMKVREA